MKLSEYARKLGLTYKTVYRMYKRGEIDAYQLETGTIIVRESEVNEFKPTKVALYARVSSHGQKEDMTRQLDRLRNYASAQGYRVDMEVTEVASGMNDTRPKFNRLLSNQEISLILVEHKDRATRFGFNQLQAVLQAHGRKIEVINQAETKEELVDDFIAIITSMCARIYGRRQSKNRADRMKAILDE